MVLSPLRVVGAFFFFFFNGLVIQLLSLSPIVLPSLGKNSVNVLQHLGDLKDCISTQHFYAQPVGKITRLCCCSFIV